MGDNTHIKKITASEYVVFVCDGLGKLIGEYSADGPPQAPMVQYTATDPLGSPRVLTNELGEIVSRRDFMPFGEEVAADQTYRTAVRAGVLSGAWVESLRVFGKDGKIEKKRTTKLHEWL
jgi:hypothetical protein